jgi:hypothetical protein
MQRPLPAQDNTKRNTRKNLHASSGIRTHNPNNQAAKTYALDRAVTGTGPCFIGNKKFNKSCIFNEIRKEAGIVWDMVCVDDVNLLEGNVNVTERNTEALPDTSFC